MGICSNLPKRTLDSDPMQGEHRKKVEAEVTRCSHEPTEAGREAWDRFPLTASGGTGPANTFISALWPPKPHDCMSFKPLSLWCFVIVAARS